ncbi:myotubularin-related protein 11 isoform X2 [Erythrolamprus reginae]|uniref:myotubularin-related protein 11 isoform X2 n=1 Tax=Erythrolamprus reginae TaxID=121349 RepID=UPI00396C35CE
MLSMSKNSFKIKHPLQDTGPRSPPSPNMNRVKNGKPHSLQCIAGEYVQEAAGGVRKSISSPGGGGHIPGTLYCTNLRVAFLPDSSPNNQNDSCCPFMCSDYEVALPCVGKLVAVNSFTKAKVLTGTSALKVTPEELVIYCRDFRVLRFRFHESGSDSPALRVTMAIAQAQETSGRDPCYEYLTLKNLENSWLTRQGGQPQEGSSAVLFEALCDWEKELERLGAAGWRVSPVNERFDMSTSLPKYLCVPSRFLDNELKRAFVHFNERRIPHHRQTQSVGMREEMFACWNSCLNNVKPLRRKSGSEKYRSELKLSLFCCHDQRLCWHHPRGSDLLRAANFHTNSDPEKGDIRAIERLLFAGHSQCVLVEATADLPSLTEIHQSYSKLWSLSLWLTDPSVAPSDEKWLSSLENTRWLDHVRSCLKKASEVTLLLTERSRSVVLQEPGDRDLNCLLASLVQVLSDPYARTLRGFQGLVQKEWIAAGHPFLQRLNVLQKNDQDESPVFFLFLDSIWQLLQQFPQSFEFTEAYLMAMYDSCFVPFSSTFLFNCQWERSRKNQNRFLNQIYTPVNGWQENLCLEILQKGSCPFENAGHANLPTVWNWLLRGHPWQRTQFRNPWYTEGPLSSSSSSGRAPNKNSLFTNGGDKMETSSSEKWALCVFSKGSLSWQASVFPWRNGALPKKCFHRGVQAPETSREQKRSWEAKPNGSFIYHHDSLLLPSHTGTSIRLWKRCYFRGNPEVQVGLFASNIVKLSEELDLLQNRLTYLQARGSYSITLENA